MDCSCGEAAETRIGTGVYAEGLPKARKTALPGATAKIKCRASKSRPKGRGDKEGERPTEKRWAREVTGHGGYRAAMRQAEAEAGRGRPTTAWEDPVGRKLVACRELAVEGQGCGGVSSETSGKARKVQGARGQEACRVPQARGGCGTSLGKNRSQCSGRG